LDRRTDTSDGSGGASPTVVTERDDDDDLMAETDQDTQIIPTTPVRAARAAVARATAAAKEILANGISATTNGTAANGGPAADEQDAVADEVPALPADTIGLPRDSSGFSRPVSGPVSPDPGDGWMPSDNGMSLSADAPASSEAEAEPAVAETGTGWPVASSLLDTGASTPPSGGPEPSTVSAAAFVWDPPEPAATSPSSPARNFLRSSASTKTTVPPRTPPASAGPPKAPAGARPKASSKRSVRQAHLTIARIEPWSVMKFSFVVSLVAFVILFVAVSVIYGTLSALGVFTSLQHVVQSVTSSQDSQGVNAAKWFTASRILSYTALLGAINIVLITAMSTIGAVVYNLTSRLIGGVEVTLREAE
jgi:hypothetical protein